MREALAAYDFSVAVDELYHFVWDEVCDWYLELVKARLYSDDDERARRRPPVTPCSCSTASCGSLHPFLPFVTEEIASHYGAAPLLERGYAVAGPDDVRARRRGGARRRCRPRSRRCAPTAPTSASPRRSPARAFVADDGGDAARRSTRRFDDAFRALSRVEIGASATGRRR